MPRQFNLMVLAVSAFAIAALASSAHADPVNLEGGYSTLPTFTGATFSIVGDDTYDPVTGNPDPYNFELDLTLQPGSLSTDLGGGYFDVTGTYSGTYTFFIGTDTNVVSSGTLTADGEYITDGTYAYGPSLTNGVATQTSGPGFDIYPGVTQFTFSAQGDIDGPFFRGTLSPASSVPLPAAATMGIGLLSILAPLAIRRRKSIA
ncbi:MAG TPA: hypothetical protein VGG19_02285 [Tepidisphaeraceae bacterium]|jgi:hypothetical protein